MQEKNFPAKDNNPAVCVILPADSDKELTRLCSLDPENDCKSFKNGSINWTTQLYTALKKKGFQVIASNVPHSDCINIAHASNVNFKKFKSKHFLAEIMADRRPCGIAKAHIVQNKLQADDKRFFWMPHWPQPGLRKRSAQRKHKIKVCAYAGKPHHIIDSPQTWTDALRERGIEFRMLDVHQRGNLDDIDCLLGIRKLREKNRYYFNKPPSKLVNAWLAEIPFIGGNDSAYSQVGCPGKDYLIADNMEQALRHIDDLKKMPDLFFSLIENGKNKSRDFTREAISLRWLNLIQHKLVPMFERWKASSSWTKNASYMLSPIYGAILRKKVNKTKSR